MSRQWVTLVVLAFGSTAHAQPLEISSEIDPIVAGRTGREDWPTMTPLGEGFAIAGVAAFDGALRPVTPPAFLASCLPGAIGTTTCLRADGSGVRRMSLLDGTILDASPHDVASPFGGWPLVAASGDDYLIVLASGQLHLWRSGAAPGATELVPMCPRCYVNAIACTPRRCSALIANGWRDGTASLFRVDVGPTPALGPSVMLGTAAHWLVALDDQWVVAPTGGVLAFFDDALVSLGTVPAPSAALGCVHDACLGLDTLGAVSRCRSGVCAPFGSLPRSLVGDMPRLTCGTVSCGVMTSVAMRPRIGGLSGRDGSSVDLVDAYWSRVADELWPHVAVTSSGPLVAYTDTRGGSARAALARVAPGVQTAPIFADLGVVPGVRTTAVALLPSAMGATMLRRDESPVPAPAGSWVRISPSGTPIDLRRDAFTCAGVLAAGPHGIEMACGGLRRTIGPASLMRVSDDGRPIGPSRPLRQLGFPTGLALGDACSLAISQQGGTVVIDEPDGTTSTGVNLNAPLASGLVAAAGAGRFLVVSNHWGSPVFGTIVDCDGNTTPLLRIADPGPTGPASAALASAVFDGSTFLVVWLESTPDGASRGLMLRRVRADGAVDPDTHLLAMAGPQRTPLLDVRPDIATDGAGRSAVAFVRNETGPGHAYVVSSVHAIAIRSLAPIGSVCIGSSECGSGVCADRVCCAVPCDGAGRACSTAAGGRANGVCTAIDVDAGRPPDTGRPPDAGSARDAIARPDASPGTALRPRGCGCSAARTAPTFGALLTFALLVALRAARRALRAIAAAWPRPSRRARARRRWRSPARRGSSLR